MSMQALESGVIIRVLWLNLLPFSDCFQWRKGLNIISYGVCSGKISMRVDQSLQTKRYLTDIDRLFTENTAGLPERLSFYS